MTLTVTPTISRTVPLNLKAWNARLVGLRLVKGLDGGSMFRKRLHDILVPVPFHHVDDDDDGMTQS